MTPDEFLKQWKSQHINSGTQQNDAAELAHTLVADASAQGISREMLEHVAGAPLKDYLVDSIREAIAEELW